MGWLVTSCFNFCVRIIVETGCYRSRKKEKFNTFIISLGTEELTIRSSCLKDKPISMMTSQASSWAEWNKLGGESLIEWYLKGHNSNGYRLR